MAEFHPAQGILFESLTDVVRTTPLEDHEGTNRSCLVENLEGKAGIFRRPGNPGGDSQGQLGKDAVIPAMTRPSNQSSGVASVLGAEATNVDLDSTARAVGSHVPRARHHPGELQSILPRREALDEVVPDEEPGLFAERKLFDELFHRVYEYEGPPRFNSLSTTRNSGHPWTARP